MTTKEIQNRLLKKESEIISAAKLYCSENKISFTQKHDLLLRHAMRTMLHEGMSPILKKIFHEKNNVLTNSDTEPAKRIKRTRKNRFS